MLGSEIVFDPCDQVILKGSLDKLMQKIWREQLMDVRTRKVLCKWLKTSVINYRCMRT